MVPCQGLSIVLLLADWTVIGHNQVTLSECKSIFPSPCISLHPYHHGHFAYESFEWWQEWQGKEANWYPQKRSTHPLDYLNSPWLSSFFGENSHETQISSHILPIQRGLSIYLFPQISLSQVFQSCSFYVLDHPAQPLATAHELI